MVGGGVAGLTAAFDLTTTGITATVFEASPRVGGQVRTRRADGFVVDDGAEGFVAGDEDVVGLCQRLGLANELIEQRHRESFALRDGALEPLAAGEAASLLGIQVTRSDLGRGLTSLRRGMGQLTDALASQLQGPVHLNTRAVGISPEAAGITVQFAGGTTSRFDAVVLAIPPHVMAPLVRPWASKVAAVAEAMRFQSNVSVSLGCPRDAVADALMGSGFVAAPGIDTELRACAYSSSKFSGRAGEESVLLRAFFRPSPDWMYRPDGVWVARAVEALSPVIGLTGPTTRAWVSRWPDALSQYGTDHEQVLGAITEELRRNGPVEVAGSAYHRAGLPGAVLSGRNAAYAVSKAL